MKSWQTSEQPSNCFPGEGEGKEIYNLVEEKYNLFYYFYLLKYFYAAAYI